MPQQKTLTARDAKLVQWLNEHGREAHTMKTEFQGEAGAEEAGA